jgi:hypothetical protein
MILETVTAFLNAIGQVFGFVNKRTDLKNAPDVRAAQVGQDEVDRKNAIEADVAKKNVDGTRENIAE